jgi:transposase
VDQPAPELKIQKPPESELAATPYNVLVYISVLEHALASHAVRLAQLEAERHTPSASVLHQLRALEERLAALEAENAALRETVAQNSSNSSKPPSSDPPGTPPRRSRSKGTRRRGGQPGHPRHERRLVEVERCRSVTRLMPDECRGCGHALGPDDLIGVRRHQVVELPRVEPIVDEYQIGCADCPRCGTRTQADVPDAARRGFGPRLQALVADLRTQYRLSTRQVSSLMRQHWGVGVSTGSTISLTHRAAGCLSGPVAEIRQGLEQAPVVGADETSWPVRAWKGEKTTASGWLWVVCTLSLVLLVVQRSRNQEAAKTMLGYAPPIVVTDRYGGYGWLEAAGQQWCWSHVIRGFQKMSEREGESGRIGAELVRLSQELFHAKHEYDAGRLTRRQWQGRADRQRRLIRGQLERGAEYPDGPKEATARARTARTCRKLLKQEARLWWFVRDERVPATNNQSERALRAAVIVRKVSLGSDSEAGAASLMTVLSVVQTLRAQGREVLEFLELACRAPYTKETIPSILPS